MDSNSICIFNEYFEEEIVNEKGKICLYNPKSYFISKGMLIKKI